MNRNQEIEQRLNAIAAELDRLGDGITAEELRTLTTEVETLKAERKALLGTAQSRAALLDSIAEGRTGSDASIITRLTPNIPIIGESEAASDDPFGTMAYRKAFMAYVMRGAEMPAEYRSMEGITHTTDVGSVIPTPVLNRIIEKMESSGMILPLITRTNFRGGLTIPTSSVKPVAVWVAEGAGSPDQKKPTGEINFKYHKLRCAVAVTLEVATMALDIFESRLVDNVVEAMVIALEHAIINGTGIGQPRGILIETPASGQLIDVQTPSYQDLLDAESALPTAYESNARWCMTKTTFYRYFGLVDANGQPIGRMDHGITGRAERVLVGRPVVICDYLPSFTNNLGAGTPFAFLFNFRDYILNSNLGMNFKRYTENSTDDEVSRAVMLTDGQVVDKNSLVVLNKRN